MFGFGRKPVRAYSVKDYLDEVTAGVMGQVTHFPPAGWFEDYLARQDQAGAPGETSFPPTALVFPGRSPSVFYEREHGVPYRGQDMAKEMVDINISALQPGERFKCLITGMAGLGKTALAKIVARRLRYRLDFLGATEGRYFQILPDQINTKAVLDRFMQQLEEGDVVFIDEVHALQDVIGVTALYNVLADGDEAKYPLSGGGWVMVPPMVSWITATTDPGRLDSTNGGALLRRLQPEIPLQDPSKDDLVHILQDQEVEIHPDAAYEIAERSGGLPWQALLIHGQARAVARSLAINQILPGHANKAFELMGLDEHGLLPRDRKVLQILMGVKHTQANGRVVYKMSEAALLAAAGLDKGTYKDRVQPKLQRAGLLTTVGGQALTEKALEWYGHLKPEGS